MPDAANRRGCGEEAAAPVFMGNVHMLLLSSIY